MEFDEETPALFLSIYDNSDGSFIARNNRAYGQSRDPDNGCGDVAVAKERKGKGYMIGWSWQGSERMTD